MIQACQPGCFPNGLSPCYVNPAIGEVEDYIHEHWRTYQTAPQRTFQENYEADIIGYIFCESLSHKSLGKLFTIKEKFHHRYYGSFSEMMFETRFPVDLNEIRAIMNDIEEYQEVYTWIPTKAVLLGRRICFATYQNQPPHCKITGVTGDDGKIHQFMVTIFLNANALLQDLNRELAFYDNLKGQYKINFELDIEGIRFPRKARYRHMKLLIDQPEQRVQKIS